ncbi:hypothetical protein [Streptomyces sp. DSM 40484]|uniref:hypothetical protein n=1 Tax=Streptomyces kroppenstedtii TaxID=3051181 RepID=UPI0028CFFCD1|nr:hypothetical protein [Streptomyces sp. DSM 40484]
MNATDLIAAAQAAHADYLADQAREQAEDEAAREIDRQSTIEIASAHALQSLGTAAETLTWRHHPEAETTDFLSAAIAALPPGRVHDGRLVYLHDSHNNSQTLALVRTCRACTDELVNDVDSLAELGALLDDGPDPDPQCEAANEAPEPGPLTAVEAAEQRAATITALARRLLARHPDAGLTVDTVAVFGHGDGGGSAELRLAVDGLDALGEVASAMGLDVTIRTTGTHPGMVLKHGIATHTVDGIEVQYRAHTRLTDDEAATWLAQQNQPTTAASDGGDV